MPPGFVGEPLAQRRGATAHHCERRRVRAVGGQQWPAEQRAGRVLQLVGRDLVDGVTQGRRSS
jgi:hypothetical protein